MGQTAAFGAERKFMLRSAASGFAPQRPTGMAPAMSRLRQRADVSGGCAPVGDRTPARCLRIVKSTRPA